VRYAREHSQAAAARMFSINPVWRGETQGSYFFVFNAILNFDSLSAGCRLDEK